MSEKLTEAVFSMQCSFIAKNAAAWAGDILTLPENYNHKSDWVTVSRFTDEMRSRLNRLDERAGRPSWTAMPLREKLTAEEALQRIAEAPFETLVHAPGWAKYFAAQHLSAIRKSPKPSSEPTP